MLGSVWPLVSPRKDGKGDKTSLNTSVVIGRAQADEPRSTVVFYRSHFGGLGDLLSELVGHRQPHHGGLVVQSDLSTVNLVPPEIRERFAIAQAGCASHARRPFVRHQADDPEACGHILDLFEGIFMFEGMLDSEGRNRSNIAAVREVDERACWEELREACTALQLKWPRTTELGQAARYLLRHYDTLTYYLSDPRVAASNNLSERMLRMEKLISNNSMFRQSLEGRFALDVMRTVLQTAIAADVELRAYIIWVLQMPADAVAADPAAFTPMAFAQWWAEQTSLDELTQAAV